MVLETLRRESQPNLKSLALEVPTKRRHVFDPQKEITEDDWADIIYSISPYNNNDDDLEAIPAAIILDPTIKSDLTPSGIATFLERAKSSLDDELSYQQIARIVDPDSCPYGYLDENDPLFTDPQKRIIKNLNDLFTAHSLRLVYANIPPDHFKRTAILDYLRGESRTQNIQVQLQDHAIARIINPSVVNEAEPSLLRACLSLLEESRSEGDWSKFVILAGDLYIVTAASVEVTREGLKIETYESSPFTTQTPPLPHTRRF